VTWIVPKQMLVSSLTVMTVLPVIGVGRHDRAC